VLDGKEKATNPIRELFKNIQKDKIPRNWRVYTVEDMSTQLFLDDFCQRVEMLHKLSAQGAGKYGRSNFWLGGLMNPEAFVAASRQAVAQAHNWSLEQLKLEVTVANDANDKVSPDSFVFDQLTIFGASWKNGALSLSNDVSFSLPATRFTWVLIDEKKKDDGTYASVPVYLNANRTNFLFSLNLRCPKDLPPTVWSQRGTCLTVWHQHA